MFASHLRKEGPSKDGKNVISLPIFCADQVCSQNATTLKPGLQPSTSTPGATVNLSTGVNTENYQNIIFIFQIAICALQWVRFFPACQAMNANCNIVKN